MRGNLPVPSHRAARRRAAALFPAVGIFKMFLEATICLLEDKAVAGFNPATPATLVF